MEESNLTKSIQQPSYDAVTVQPMRDETKNAVIQDHQFLQKIMKMLLKVNTVAALIQLRIKNKLFLYLVCIYEL